jgi:hypothetical protein
VWPGQEVTYKGCCWRIGDVGAGSCRARPATSGHHTACSVGQLKRARRSRPLHNGRDQADGHDMSRASRRWAIGPTHTCWATSEARQLRQQYHRVPVRRSGGMLETAKARLTAEGVDAFHRRTCAGGSACTVISHWHRRSVVDWGLSLPGRDIHDAREDKQRAGTANIRGDSQ